MKKKPDELLAELPEGIVEERLKTFGAYYKLHFEPKYDGIFLNLPLLRHALERSMLNIYSNVLMHKYYSMDSPLHLGDAWEISLCRLDPTAAP